MTTLENYSHIELTDQEIEEALRQARKKKHFWNQEQEYLNRLKQPVTYPIFNAETLRIKVLDENSDFIIDDFNRDIFENLCLYFSGDKRFEDTGMSLRKGILLYGPVGCGKSRLMRMFVKNSFRPYVINPVRKISDEYADRDGGVSALNKYSSLVEVYPHENFGINFAGRCLDDIGTEDERKNFGNEMNVIQDILYKIYDNRQAENFHGTTNLNVDRIEAVYGSRIRSRLREMFNVLSFSTDSPDRRK